MDFMGDASRGIEKVPILVDLGVCHEDVNDFVYVVKAVPGPGSQVLQFEDEFEGCHCKTQSRDDRKACLRNTCSCLKTYGSPYNERGILVSVDPYNTSMKPIYECNKFCKCSPNCINRVVQGGITTRLQIFQTSRKGLGLRTLDIIEKGRFVCEYAGQVLSKKIAKHRAESQQQSDCNYILALKEHLANGQVISTYVDPKVTGNAGRFINHSCDPNLFMVPVRIDNDVPRLALFALRDINSGEELCYDYSGEILPQYSTRTSTDSEDSEVKKIDTIVALNQGAGRVKYKACLCGSKVCRGFLPMDESLYK